MRKYYIVLFVLMFCANANAAIFHTNENTFTISESITPDFPQSLSICSGSVAPVLPTVSPNGVTGTWTPAVINTAASAIYTFTPTPGQDATIAIMSVTIAQIITPTFNQVAPIAACSTAPSLPGTSTNGISGTWSPTMISTNASDTYMFTPNAGQCAASATMNITVTPYPFTFVLFCDTANSTPTSLAFDFNNVGQTSFDFSYTVDGGQPVTGNIVSPSNYSVPITAGQSVTFTVTAVGVPCVPSLTTTCQSLAIPDFNEDKFSVYPNPVHDVLTIDAGDQIQNITIYNILGQKMLEKLTFESKSYIDFTKFEKGLYFLRMASASGTKTIRIIKD
ncbi:MAG TPA: T9SS type A sorting domain-containing protein [Flavobacterium sp.]|nr:T9SS type A sorting domain-containing protein [Flavobacterium sp.]